MGRNIELVTPIKVAEIKRKNVCAYARVSSGKDAMLHSLSAQVSYYQKFIGSNPEWKFCGIYADEALTGTKDNREQFQAMLAECRAGRIDMVVTKSITRFARNTITLLETVREFKQIGVDVFFEEQNIHTLSADGELMLTILASYAQEESLSASENAKWRIRKGYENGELMNLRVLYGYNIKKGFITIDEPKAEIVRRIYSLFLAGESLANIAKGLNAEGIPSPHGLQWNSKKVRAILLNEKYAGNAIMQKYYSNNHLEKKKKINRGELPMFYFENSHPAIIDLVTYEAAKAMLDAATEYFRPEVAPSESPFSKKMVCGLCGGYIKRAKNNGRTIWNCNKYLTQGTAGCDAKEIRNDRLEAICCEVFGMDSFDADVIGKKVQKIIVFPRKLIFILTDGKEIEKVWQHTSRSKSWTPEMREKARQRALMQRGGQGCQK